MMTMTDRNTSALALALALGSAVVAIGAAIAAKRATDRWGGVDERVRAALERAEADRQAWMYQ